MAYSEEDQDPTTDQDQQYQLTGDDLSALHGVAWQMQNAGDPRAQKLWNIIAAYSGGTDSSERPAFTMRQSPLKTTSWQDDLEKELWGDAGSTGQSVATTNAPGDDGDDSKVATGSPETTASPETADFLDDLSGIGLHAYLAMRDPELPGYKDWRDGYFVRQGSNYVSREGEAYTNDELKQAHQVLSHQAGNPLISNLFIGPKFQTADYLVWRNQNFSDDGGPWQDDEGNIYSEPALQEMFGAKFTTQPDDPSAQAADEEAEPQPSPQPQSPAQSTAGGNSSGDQTLPAIQPNERLSQIAAGLKQSADFLKWRDERYRAIGDGKWEGPDAFIYTDKDLRDIYEIDNKQWPKPVPNAAQSSGMTVTLTYPNGMIEQRTGNHPQRDNNPGNMKYGPFTRSQGALAADRDKKIAIFSTSDAGWAAMDADLKSDKWQSRTIDQAIASWAPKNENNTAAYQRKVRAALGVAGSTKISELTPQQFETLKQKIAQLEGFYDQAPGNKANVIVQPPKRPNVIPKNLGEQ